MSVVSNSQNFASPPRWLGVDLVKNRWIFPFLGLFTTLMGGAAYAFSVFILPLEAEFGWVRADTVLAFSVCMFVFGILMAVGGYFVDKYGPKKPFVLGAALMIASQVLSSQITTLTGLVLTYGVVLGIGIGLTYTSATIALTSRWYPEREKRSLMIGVAVVGFGLGAVVAAPLWAAGIAAYGWRTTYMLTGGVFAVVLGVIATIIQFPPINYQFSADKGWQPLAGGAVTQKQAVAVNPEDLTLADAVKNGLFWFTGFSFFLTIFGGLMAVSQLAAFAGAAPPVGIGLAPLITATVIQAKAVNNGLGRPVWGWVAGKIGPKNALITVALFMALSLYVLSISESRAMVTLGAALVGLSFGGALALNPVIATFMFGPSYIARIYGLIFFMGFGFGGFFGPRVGGLLFTATGSYDAPFLLAAGLAITSAVLSALIFPAKGKEKQRRSQELVKAA
ncbi:MFS transporter, OFA family, oxalate/formate antiporter [Candidatus Hakubella thermalkaliphila]|uniref:MFS transporter, OFA family, oxalate/formate antiporter n=2 Tax=Candidatus Hakubella thermalkaliphila TaxID=2754717 RepID=A0A6V8Q4L4_9ACTN|nr:hypothetical protein HKBW3S09_01323 [Candidatus Hakubella thermalkaliphila]GFP37861.1 MFS transporter, OFA family, oxalate/formate antiporter [Candidatus Hakubella thermalkaliphila]